MSREQRTLRQLIAVSRPADRQDITLQSTHGREGERSLEPQRTIGFPRLRGNKQNRVDEIFDGALARDPELFRRPRPETPGLPPPPPTGKKYLEGQFKIE